MSARASGQNDNLPFVIRRARPGRRRHHREGAILDNARDPEPRLARHREKPLGLFALHHGVGELIEAVGRDQATSRVGEKTTVRAEVENGLSHRPF